MIVLSYHMLTNIVQVIEGEKKINRKGNKINSIAGGSSYLVKDATYNLKPTFERRVTSQICSRFQPNNNWIRKSYDFSKLD